LKKAGKDDWLTGTRPALVLGVVGVGLGWWGVDLVDTVNKAHTRPKMCGAAGLRLVSENAC